MTILVGGVLGERPGTGRQSITERQTTMHADTHKQFITQAGTGRTTSIQRGPSQADGFEQIHLSEHVDFVPLSTIAVAKSSQ